jgi:hypothetical protein
MEINSTMFTQHGGFNDLRISLDGGSEVNLQKVACFVTHDVENSDIDLFVP